MNKFGKKTETIKGTVKGIVIHDGMIMDEDSGELVELAKFFKNLFGEDTPFDLSVTLKSDEEIDV